MIPKAAVTRLVSFEIHIFKRPLKQKATMPEQAGLFILAQYLEQRLVSLCFNSPGF